MKAKSVTNQWLTNFWQLKLERPSKCTLCGVFLTVIFLLFTLGCWIAFPLLFPVLIKKVFFSKFAVPEPALHSAKRRPAHHLSLVSGQPPDGECPQLLHVPCPCGRSCVPGSTSQIGTKLFTRERSRGLWRSGATLSCESSGVRILQRIGAEALLGVQRGRKRHVLRKLQEIHLVPESGGRRSMKAFRTLAPLVAMTTSSLLPTRRKS